MSTKQNAMTWYRDFDRTAKREQLWNKFSAVLARAEAALESCDNASLVNLIEEALKLERYTREETVVLHCLQADGLCKLSRYEEARATLAGYELELPQFPEKLQAQLLLRIGRTGNWLGQYPKATSRLMEGLHIFTTLNEPEGIAESYLELSRLYTNIHEYSIARDYITRALAVAETLSNLLLMGHILLHSGVISHYDGDFAGAKAHYNRGLKLAEGSRDFRLLGVLHFNLANTLFFEERGSVEQIISLYEKAIRCFEQQQTSDLLAHCYNNLSDSLLRFGMWQKAGEVLERALELSDRSNDNWIKGLSLITLGELNICRGNITQAKRFLTNAIKLLEQLDKGALAHAKRALGYACKEGSPAAFKAFESSLQLAIAVGDHNEIIFSQLALAEFYCRRASLPQAQTHLQQAQERLNNKPSPYISGFMQRMIGRLKALAEAYTEAAQHITVSTSIFTAIGDPYELGRSYMELAQVLIEGKSYDRARLQIKQAREIFEQLGAQLDIERAITIEGQLPAAGNNNATPANIAPIQAISDLTLLKRLSQASITSEILLQEFTNLMSEIFSVNRLLIFQAGRHEPELLLCHGYRREEALRQYQTLTPLLNQDYKLLTNGAMIRFSCERYTSLYLYFETASGTPDQHRLERIELFLEVLKLGLEKCVLRNGPAIETPISAAKPTATGQNFNSQNFNGQSFMEGFIYASPAMNRIVDQIRKIRTSDVTVLITGESGTGKELIARAIHNESVRVDKQFTAFNCTAAPRELIESQLFGHKRGSFTGATSDYSGVIRAAKGGTIFLDEIGDLSLDLQPKLLRFLEYGEIQTLGEVRPAKVDVRVIAATNLDLAQAVADRRFREDLYYRLNIINIHIPPLRERSEEVPLLAHYYLDQLSKRYGDRRLTIAPETMAALEQYRWPGNVRQLRNEIERCFSYAGRDEMITLEHLSEDIRNNANARLTLVAQQPAPAFTLALPTKPESAGDPQKLRDVMRPFERDLILSALEHNRWNISKTAEELGMSRRGLRLKIKRYGIN